MSTVEQLNKDLVLGILTDVHNILMFTKNWSGCISSLKDEEESDPSEADSWSFLGAIEKVLLDRNEYKHLAQIVNELEKDNEGTLCLFEEKHCHREIFEWLYTTMGRIADELEYNMYTPLFPISEDFDLDNEIAVLFIPREFDEALEKSEKEQEEKYEEACRRDSEALFYSREDDE